MSDDLNEDQTPESAAPAPGDDEYTKPDEGGDAGVDEDSGAGSTEPVESEPVPEADAEAGGGDEATENAPGSAEAEELAASALDAVSAALGEINGSEDEPPPRDDGAGATSTDGATPMDLPSLTRPKHEVATKDVSLISDVALRVTIELGRTRMSVEEVLRLGDGSVVELDKLAGDPVDIFVNGRQVARGEVLVLNENLCVRVSEILDPSAQVGGELSRKGA